MIGSKLSDPVELTLGSPQGSILSPSIFLILIADMELYCTDATICSYADDTTVTVAVKNMNELREKCEEKVNSLLKYMAINKLACNDDKTHILVIKHGQNNNDDLTFRIGGFEIKEKNK